MVPPINMVQYRPIALASVISKLVEVIMLFSVGYNLNVNLNNLGLFMYADDLVLISPSSTKLSQLLHECEKFGTLIGMI